jgi:hypothetical protein
MNKALSLAIVGLLISGSRLWAQGPELLSIGTEESAGGSGRLSSVAVDSLNQPHIVCDGGTFAYFYDKIGGTWAASSFDAGTLGYKQYYNPHLEIDSADRAWVSGILVSGLGLIVRENMSTTPSTAFFSDQRIQGAWDSGNLSIDPGAPLDSVLMSARGRWKKVRYSATEPSRVTEVGSGAMYAGADGEKKGFWISKAGNVSHADRSTRGVWHLAIGGYSAAEPDQYQNSIRQALGLPRVTWASYSPYTTMEDDGTYVDCVSDTINPQIAYMTTDFSIGGKISGTAGVAMNIWNGSAMVFPSTAILSVDPAGSCGMRRFAPQLAPAKNGGVFITWVRGGRVKLRYISAAGVPGTEWDISAGNLSSICTDPRGNLHIVYSNRGIKYRKLLMSGGTPCLTVAGDYNGDGRDDLGIFDPNTANWYVKNLSNDTTLLWDHNWGWSATLPVPSDYDGDGVADLGVFHPGTGNWFIWSLAKNQALANPFQWGSSGMLPVPGDYDGDGSADLMVYSENAGDWYAISLKTGKKLGTELNWGFPGSKAVPGDFNGDGRDDLAIFDPANGNWYIKELDLVLADGVGWGWPTAATLAGDYNGDGADDLVTYDSAAGKWYIRTLAGTVLAFPVEWGFRGTVAVPGDYNGDHTNDLAVFNPATGNWYIKQLTGEILAWEMNWGFAGCIPVPGDYNGDHTNDLAVYHSASGKWYIQTLSGTVLADGVNWGFPGTTAVPGDYNRDGRADLAVFDPATGNWYVRTLGGTVLANAVNWGYSGVQAVAGDYDGDGASDLAVFDAARNRWHVYSLFRNISLMSNAAWGSAGMRPVPGDYDGDGETELALFDPGKAQWNIRKHGKLLRWAFNWGWAGVIPVQGDFNHDGFDDLTIYDASSGRWFSRSSQNDQTLLSSVQYGTSSMIPTPGDYDGDGFQDIAVFDKNASKWYIWSTGRGFDLAYGYQWGFPGAIPLGSRGK